MSTTTPPPSATDAAEPDPAFLGTRTREYVDTEILPVEDRFDGDVTLAGGDRLRRRLQDGARRRGLLAPHAPVAHGGLGLSMVRRAHVFEAAGRSLFGAMAINAAAPTRATCTCSRTSPPRRSKSSTWGRWCAGRSARLSP
ncbi:acyl-CoA dehydrogenase family protein [Blastococcus sp. SYSU DS0973]